MSFMNRVGLGIEAPRKPHEFYTFGGSYARREPQSLRLSTALKQADDALGDLAETLNELDAAELMNETGQRFVVRVERMREDVQDFRDRIKEGE